MKLLRKFTPHIPDTIKIGPAPDPGAGAAGRLLAEWSADLSETATGLRRIAGNTEDEFIAVGSRLFDFAQRSTAIAGKASELSEELSGEGIGTVTENLRTVLDKMYQYLAEGEKEAARGVETLTGIAGRLNAVDAPLTGFRKVIKVLHMLGTSTKIESSRLGQDNAGFRTLADDVEKLSHLVEKKTSAILEHKDGLLRAIGEVISRIQHTKAQQRDNTRNLLDELRSGLSLLMKNNDSCMESTRNISSGSEEVSSRVSEVVMSMQFHDITRQQIEHVIEALEELPLELDQPPSSVGGAQSPGSVEETARMVGGVCSLQSLQLTHSRNEMGIAVSSIKDNLRSVAARESEMARDIRALTGVAGNSGNSFLGEMKKSLSIITGELANSTEEYRKLSATLISIGDTVGEISKFVSDIEEIGTEIELIALNAQIKAAHTGEEGKALGVLAEEIQRLSVDARALTDSVSQTLKMITAATDELLAETGSESALIENEGEEMIREILHVTDTLEQMNQRLMTAMFDIDRMVDSLSRDITEAVEGMTMHERFDRVMAEALARLERVLEKAREHGHWESGAMSAEQVVKLRDRYTMHSERKVHEAFAAGHRSPAVARKAVGAEEHFDCNVELF